MLQITPNTSLKEISDQIKKLREEKGKENEVLILIRKSLTYGHDFVINLLFEEALTYQHIVMNEDAKGDEADGKLRKENLINMEMAVKNAGYLIVRLDLDRWKSRLYRFLGRIYDYKGDFERAISCYRKSLKYVMSDPEYIEEKYPRWLEIEAFLSFSIIMSGQTSKGHTLARNVYERFDTGKEAGILKQNDYVTWAIWKSGIPVRTIKALSERGVIFDKKEALAWINDAQRILVPKNKFEYRSDEIRVVKEKLLMN